MRIVNLLKLGVGIVAALMLSIAMTASASAAEFLASKVEKLLAEKVSTQVFVTHAGTVECNTVNILAGTTALQSAEQLALVDYEKCTAFGFIEVTISPAHYTFLANGTVHILKLIKIFTRANGCEVSVPVQSTNKVDYKTNGNNILIEPLVTGILYTQNANCAGHGQGSLLHNGTYKGHLEVMIPNGTLKFDP
jgi:hypothetical protein